MPVITPSAVQSIGRSDITQTTLNGTDSFVYPSGSNCYLYLRNPTGGSLSPIIDGDGAVSEYLTGVGTVSTSGGFAVGSIAAGAMAVVDLGSIKSYLKGAISITGGTGLIAILAVG